MTAKACSSCDERHRAQYVWVLERAVRIASQGKGTKGVTPIAPAAVTAASKALAVNPKPAAKKPPPVPKTASGKPAAKVKLQPKLKLQPKEQPEEKPGEEVAKSSKGPPVFHRELRSLSGPESAFEQESTDSETYTSGENRVLREQQQRQQEQTALLTRLAESMTELARNTKREEPRKLLFDTKGIGKPEGFNNEEHTFRKWVRSVTNLVVSVFGKEFEKVLDWCLDQDGPCGRSRGRAWGAGRGVRFTRHRGPIVSFAFFLNPWRLVIGCSNGFEAWRRIHRRWDPLTAGRKRNILRAILNPERVKRWENVRAAIEQIEDLFRRYENRKNEAGERERL